jgi:hypothetical protein
VEWVPAVESGRAVGYTLPTLAVDYLPPQIVMVPIVDVEPGSVLLAWRADGADALVEALVGAVQETLADETRGSSAG